MEDLDPSAIVRNLHADVQTIGRRLDALSRRFVAVDTDEVRVDLLELGSYNADVPALTADARNPDVLTVAGLNNPNCAGVLALTDDEETNLAVVMAARAIRPELPVIARAASPTIKLRMSAVASPTIIDPFDRFGDHFRVALRAPATEQLSHWLVDEVGAPLPPEITAALDDVSAIPMGYPDHGWNQRS